MKTVKDLTPADLVCEGRRQVVFAGEYEEGFGYRAYLVFEDHPYRFSMGQDSNVVGRQPPIYFPAKAETDESYLEAKRAAINWSRSQFGTEESDYDEISRSSIRAYNLAQRVKVNRAPEDNRCWLSDGFENEMHFDDYDAVRLYQDLAKAYSLPFRESCSCGELLNEKGKCAWCELE